MAGRRAASALAPPGKGSGGRACAQGAAVLLSVAGSAHAPPSRKAGGGSWDGV